MQPALIPLCIRVLWGPDPGCLSFGRWITRKYRSLPRIFHDDSEEYFSGSMIRLPFFRAKGFVAA